MTSWLIANPSNNNFWPYTLHYNAGVGGTPSWYGCVRLQSDVIDRNPALLFIDFAVNDVDMISYGTRDYGFFPAAEALIRRVREALPNTAIYIWIFTWPPDYSGTPARIDGRDLWINLANHYGITLLRWDLHLETLLPDPYDDADVEAYVLAPGNVHPNATGHAAAYQLALTYLPLLPVPSGLPARFYAESEDFEQTPIIRTGVDNDGETGTWAGTAPARTSSTANSTISWTGTFCSFGLDTNYGAGAGVVAWSLDGGAYTNINLGARLGANVAIWNTDRGVHTITLKAISGTITINRFLAI